MKRYSNIIWLALALVVVAVIGLVSNRPDESGKSPFGDAAWPYVDSVNFEASLMTIHGFRPGVTADKIKLKYDGLGVIGNWYFYGIGNLRAEGGQWAFPMLAVRFDSEGRAVAIKGTYLKGSSGGEYDWEYLARTEVLPEVSRRSGAESGGYPQLLAYDDIGLVIRFIENDRKEVYLVDPQFLRETPLEDLDPSNVPLSPYQDPQ